MPYKFHRIQVLIEKGSSIPIHQCSRTTQVSICRCDGLAKSLMMLLQRMEAEGGGGLTKTASYFTPPSPPPLGSLGSFNQQCQSQRGEVTFNSSIYVSVINFVTVIQNFAGAVLEEGVRTNSQVAVADTVIYSGAPPSPPKTSYEGNLNAAHFMKQTRGSVLPLI